MSGQVTLFQQETNAGPSQKFGALQAAGLGNDLGEGIRGSYGIVSIKAGRFRIKYKGSEQVVTTVDQNGQEMPAGSIEVVIVKANPFLNKQYYEGKYVEGSNAPPRCFSLDGQKPSAQVQQPIFKNCALCPKNQFGSLIGDNGTKQKACRDTKKLAVVPLLDPRNESLGGPMLFRVPPSSLKDLSSLADAMKARGYPYNSVAVRIGFDMEASHPKPTFKAIRPLSDDEAEIILELFNGDGVERVLGDNDVAPVDEIAPAAQGHGAFEQEPHVPVSPQPQRQQAPMAPAAQPQQAAPQAAPAEEPPIRFAPAPIAPPPPGMGASVVQPFSGQHVAPPPASAFGGQPAPVQQAAPAAPAAPTAAKKPRTPKPEVPTQPAAPAATVERDEAPVVGTQLDSDIGNILAGLSAFTGK